MEKPGHRALRRGRVSIPSARYFLTFVTKDRHQGLASERMFQRMVQDLPDVPCETLALMVMPDHLHWLVRLIPESSLSETVRLFKGRLSPELRRLGLSWQKGAYHDRRLRPDDELAPFLRYMLCNPYRAGLLKIEAQWPYWYLAENVAAWFEPTTDEGRPYPEWLRECAEPPWEAE